MAGHESASGDGAALPHTSAAVERGISARLHIGAQVFASVAGEVRADLAFGEAVAGVALRPDSLMLWMSSVKPVVPIALLQMRERGLVDLDDPVRRHIPEFAAGGKEKVTLRQVLTHTGGFPAAGMQWSTAPWDEVLAGICAVPLEPGWVPGERCAYHVASGWYVLAEVVRRLDGRDFPRYAREEIFLPLGMRDTWIGMPPEQHRLYGERIAPMHATEYDPIPHPYWPWAGTAEACAICRPGGSAWGPARELGWLYECLLGGGERRGARVLSAASVAEMTSPQSSLYDETFKARLERGLGVVLDSKAHGPASAWYGSHCSARTFGHAGFRCSVAFADPEHGLAVAVVFNGMPTDAAHDERARAVVDAIYEDLGVVDGGLADGGR